jgi:phospholipid/cholesterol/gamma-HCH transport system substrate-binding protein
MESVKNIEFKVGVFVALGLLITCVSILLLGGDRMLFKSSYTLRADMSEVQGLAEGSVVSLAGRTVGNVTKIDFVGDKNVLELTFKIDRAVQSRIRQGSTAEVKTQGALGDKYIYINPGTLDGKVLADNDLIPTVDGSDLFSVIASKGDSLNQVFDIIHEFDNLMKTVNGDGRSQHIMENLGATTGALRVTVERINSLLAEVQGDDHNSLKKSVFHLGNILRKIDNGEGTLGALINDPSIHEGLKQLVGGSPRQRYLKGFVRDAIETNEKAK